jgi:hypothetical protein
MTAPEPEVRIYRSAITEEEQRKLDTSLARKCVELSEQADREKARAGTNLIDYLFKPYRLPLN